MSTGEIPFYSNLNLNYNELIKARFNNSATAPTTPQAGQIYFNTSDLNFYGWNGTSWINLSQVLTNAIRIVGEITNANTNPSDPSSPSVGDSYMITTNAGTVGGRTVEIGDQLTYSISGWFVIQANLVAATNAAAGYIRIATQAEARAGSLDTVAITPARLADYLSNYLYVRKTKNTVTTLTGGSAQSITHGLAVAGATDVTVEIWQGGKQVFMEVDTVDVNTISILSNNTLSNVVVIVQG